MAGSSQASESDPGGKVEVKVLQATKLGTLGRSPFDDKFCVRLSLGNQTFTTRAKSRARLGVGFNVSWNERFTFTFVGQMPNLTLEVSGKESHRSDVFIARTTVSYEDLSSGGPSEIGVTKSYTFLLHDENGKAIATSPTLKIRFKCISQGVKEHVGDLNPILEQADLSVKHASDALLQLKGPKIPGLSWEDGSSRSAVADTAGDIGSILSKIGTIADIMDELTQIHPYAKAVWDILDLSRKVIVAQMQEDESIRDLSEQMRLLLGRIRGFVEKLDSISPSDIHADEKDTLHHVASTSRDCAKFIIGFCNKNFAKRAMKCALFGDASNKIGDFKFKFEFLEKSFNEKVWDGTSLVARQILENQKVTLVVVDRVDINTQRMLEDQTASQRDKYIVSGASLLASDKPSCFTGTRTAIMEEITAWIDRHDEDVPRVLLLDGMAGTGKSTIALTIARGCLQQSGLGASFAFNRRAQPRPMPKDLFPHIAASIAAFYPAVKDVFADTQKKEIASGFDLEGQLRELITKPLNQPTPGPIGVVVIVIDALDEADDDREQTVKLASLLATKCSELPSNIRILVTSRPETHVLEEMPSPAVLRFSMSDSTKINLFDVNLFVRDQLLSRPLKGIDEECCDRLAETSQGLFQWAATACNLIKPPLPMGSTSRKGYEMVITSGVSRDKSGLLDSLYKGVLERIGDPDQNPEGHQLLKEVLAMLFVLMEPMTLEAFRQLYVQLGLGQESDVDCTLPYLASILDGISDRTRHVQPNHTSLRDFFLDPSRSGPFCINDLLPAAHDRAARTSFSILSTTLRQDTGILDLARLSDADYLLSEADRIQRTMPLPLEYACLYCVKHLAEAPVLEEAFWADLKTSFLTDEHVLPWVEVFCLLVIHRSRKSNRSTTPELSGCIRLLAHIMKRQGSSCSSRIQAVAELTSTIVDAEDKPPFLFVPIFALWRLRDIYRSVAWTVTLQHHPKNAPSVTAGSGFFIKLSGTSHDVIFTAAHNLVDADGQPYTNLVGHIPKQVPRLNGASQFTEVEYPILPTDIRVCPGFYQNRNPETDWGVILLPRGSALRNGFELDTRSEYPANAVGLGSYGRPSWTPHHLRLPDGNSNNVVDITPTKVSATRFEDRVASGAPIYGFRLCVWGMFNHYGNEGYTNFTPALVCELGSLVGLGMRNTQMRWLPPTLSDSDDDEAHGVPKALPDWDNLYLFVNEEEGSRLYLRRGFGSSFDVSFAGISGDLYCLGYGAKLVEALDKDDDHEGRLACVAASEYKGGDSLIVQMDERVGEEEQTSRETVTLSRLFMRFDMDSTPIPSAGPDDPELFKIRLRRSRTKAKQGFTSRFRRLKFALE